MLFIRNRIIRMIGIVTQNTDPGNAELNCMFLTMKIGLLSLWISKHVRQIKKKNTLWKKQRVVAISWQNAYAEIGRGR